MPECAYGSERIHRDLIDVARGAADRALLLDRDDPRGVVTTAIYGELVARGIVPAAIMEEIKAHAVERLEELLREQSPR